MSLISNMQTFPELLKKTFLSASLLLHKNSWADKPSSPQLLGDQVLLPCRGKSLPCLQIGVSGMLQEEVATSQGAGPSRQKASA